MGAWGSRIFENDDACDFAGAIAKDRDLSRLKATLERVQKNGQLYLEAPDASEALAAADIVARLRGSWGERNAYTKAVDDWVGRIRIQPDDTLVSLAVHVVERVMSEPSELLELWSEGDASQFRQAVEELSLRLRSLGGAAPTKSTMASRLKAFFSNR